MRRVLALLLLIVCLAPGTWLRVKPLPPSDDLDLRFVELRIPAPTASHSSLGAFTLERAWRMDSSHKLFGSYSALLALGDGQLLALSDRTKLLRFSPPGAPAREPLIDWAVWQDRRRIENQDVESATADLVERTIWTGLESSNSITRHKLSDRGLSADAAFAPPGMAHWGGNSGPESLVRLKDGRFIALREGFSDLIGRRWHAALLFAGDPVEMEIARPFGLAGPAGFSPTDAAQMPDGRVLVLFRRLDWPIPARFSIRIALGDPDLIEPGRAWRLRQVAELPESLHLDNFEGLAIEPREDGKLTVWLISDDNGAGFQATYLWKLVLDPADLPVERKKARGESARPQSQSTGVNRTDILSGGQAASLCIFLSSRFTLSARGLS